MLALYLVRFSYLRKTVRGREKERDKKQLMSSLKCHCLVEKKCMVTKRMANAQKCFQQNRQCGQNLGEGYWYIYLVWKVMMDVLKFGFISFLTHLQLVNELVNDYHFTFVTLNVILKKFAFYWLFCMCLFHVNRMFQCKNLYFICKLGKIDENEQNK